jgi:hypothetical protein
MEGNSQIVLDWAKKSYSVVLDGVEVARDDSTFCPVEKDKIAFYALTPQTLTATLPAAGKRKRWLQWRFRPTSAVRQISTSMKTRSKFQSVRNNRSWSIAGKKRQVSDS